MDAAAGATGVDSAIKALDFEMESPQEGFPRDSESRRSTGTPPDAQSDPALTTEEDIARGHEIEVRRHLRPLFAMNSRHLLIGSGGVALLALLVVGLLQLPGGSQAPATATRLTVGQVRARLAGSPAPLAALHNQANLLLSGGEGALRTRLRSLRGRPVVINKWASWCQPCRSEFGAFQQASVDLGRRVAFIGIDSGDTSRTAAQAFLRAFPVSYPSYFDPSGGLGTKITDSSSMPVTVIYDARGGEYIHQGPYLSASELERDVKHFAGVA